MEGVLSTSPGPVAWSMQHSYLHVEQECRMAEEATAAWLTIWPQRLLPYKVSWWQNCHFAMCHKYKIEWNNQTSGWYGWVSGTGRPSMCAQNHGSCRVKGKGHTTPVIGRVFMYVSATSSPCGMKRWKQSLGFLLQSNIRGLLSWIYFGTTDPHSYQEASPPRITAANTSLSSKWYSTYLKL